MFRDLVDFTGYNGLAIASTLFFVVLFLAVVVRVAFLKPGYTSKMSALPLDGDAQSGQSQEHTP